MKSNNPDSFAVLAFDTSAYTSSVAALEENGRILADERRLLDVRKGDRGLRQSQAFFQHIARLPALTEAACRKIREHGSCIRAIAVSEKPRPDTDSYMPVFMAGTRTAEALSAVLDIPLYRYSHQEGHIAAAAGILPEDRRSLAFHLSGGTCELLLIEGCCPRKIIGGTKDLSFGQLIDRTGVAFGMSFPAGKQMDEAALRGAAQLQSHFSRRGRRVYEDPVLSEIHVEGTELNLSGIEKSCMDAVKQNISVERAAAELFLKIADAMTAVISEAALREEVREVILMGGVASSRFLENQLQKDLSRRGIRVVFGAPGLCTDNAVGIARLGLDQLRKMNNPGTRLTVDIKE